MNLSALLTPKQPANGGAKGLPPHHKYALVRSKVLEIIQAREDKSRRWSDTHAARRLGFRSGKEFAEAYSLLKNNGKRLVDHSDWSGVEAAIYSRFPDYEDDPKFHLILLKLQDPRVMPGGRLFSAK
jgi:hypothetical protein